MKVNKANLKTTTFQTIPLAEPPAKARKSLEFSTQKTTSQPPTTENNRDDSFTTDFVQLSQNDTTSKKRTIEELFGDIDDLLFESDAKKTKIDRNDLEMIDHIIALRQQAKEQQNGVSLFAKNAKLAKSYTAKENLSYRVPRYPFLGVTRHDGERIYIRCHSEQYEKDELEEITRNCSFKNVMKDLFRTTWNDARTLLNKQLDDEKQNSGADDVVPLEDTTCLWVELYKPRKYMELLSDETTNRTMLKWMKLWDKVVFGRRPKVKMAANAENAGVGGKFKYVPLENLLKLGEDGMPEYKIALLCGPPGLGEWWFCACAVDCLVETPFWNYYFMRRIYLFSIMFLERLNSVAKEAQSRLALLRLTRLNVIHQIFQKRCIVREKVILYLMFRMSRNFIHVDF